MFVDWMNRNQKGQVAQARLSPVRSELYTPWDVAVLKESEDVRPPNYFIGSECFGASVMIIYGSNRPIDEIREEYARALTAAHWELDPGYKPAEYFAVYKKGNEYHLTIDTSEVVGRPMDQDFQVIYSVFLAYMTPSYNGCTG